MVDINDIYSFKARVHKLKHKLDQEPKSNQEKELANKYLNQVLDCLDELRL